MKTLLSILLFFTCFSAFSQNPISTPRIRMPDRSGVDTTTVANTGQIVFDADDDKFRFNDGTGWFSFLRDDATLPYWPLTGTAAISGNTTITGGQNVLTLGHGSTGSSKFSAFSFFSGNGSDITQRLQMNSTSISSQYSNSSSDRSLSWSIGATGYQMMNDSVDVTGRLFLFADKIQFNVGSDRVVRFSPEIADIKSTEIKITNPAQLDTAAWVLVPENSTGQIKKRSVSSIVSSGAFWPLTGTASLTDDVEITSEDSLKLSPQVLMTPGQFSFVWDTTTVANNSSEVLTKDFFENFAEGMTSGYKVTAVIKITCIGVGFTQALGYYAGEKVYTVRRNYNGALTIIDSETIYQHNADEQPVDHILTVNGTGDSDDVLDLTISIGAVSNGMQFVTRVEVIYHAVYYEI